MKEENKTKECVHRHKTKSIKYFQAGDVVTAEHLNELIVAIESLEERVKKLEKSST